MIERARRFLARRARPLEYARWQHRFEGGSAHRVLDTLALYQNEDGGFGHALEPDFWNPNSSPMQTWAATEVILELGPIDAGHPVVEGILAYLDSGHDFDGGRWSRTILSNNDFPHAEWWTHRPEAPRDGGFNPTASLAGFALRFAEPRSRLLQTAQTLAERAFRHLLDAEEVEMHELSCFVRLWEGEVERSRKPLVPVLDKLRTLVNATITRDTTRWATGYVCRPSRFIHHRDDPFLPGNEDLVEAEVKFLKETQQDDGSWLIPWRWSAYDDQWPVAQAWWRSMVVIENVAFLNTFS